MVMYTACLKGACTYLITIIGNIKKSALPIRISIMHVETGLDELDLVLHIFLLRSIFSNSLLSMNQRIFMGSL